MYGRLGQGRPHEICCTDTDADDIGEVFEMTYVQNGGQHKQYLEGNSWKCAKSPTRAYKWFINNNSAKQICRFCGEVRYAELYFERAENKDKVSA